MLKKKFENNLYQQVYEKALPLLKQGRPGDDVHALEVADYVLKYGKGRENINLDVLVPVAIMHDIGHSMILPEHFHYVTGPDKLINGKLVHMLVGAKIANDILNEIEYPTQYREEIVDIISMHDADQLSTKKEREDIFNTENKKLFHDLDSLDRYSLERLKKFQAMKQSMSLDEVIAKVENITTFFFEDIHRVAQEKLEEIKNILKEKEQSIDN